jgi:hypothetical protein
MTAKDLQSRSVEDLIAEFAALAEEHEDLMGMGRVTKANRLRTRDRAIAHEIISRGEAGASAMTALFEHDVTAVRGRAAAECLRHGLARDRAINTLADICDLRAGHVSASAGHVLIVAGEFDWKTGPKRRPT